MRMHAHCCSATLFEPIRPVSEPDRQAKADIYTLSTGRRLAGKGSCGGAGLGLTSQLTLGVAMLRRVFMSSVGRCRCVKPHKSAILSDVLREKASAGKYFAPKTWAMRTMGVRTSRMPREDGTRFWAGRVASESRWAVENHRQSHLLGCREIGLLKEILVLPIYIASGDLFLSLATTSRLARERCAIYSRSFNIGGVKQHSEGRSCCGGLLLFVPGE